MTAIELRWITPDADNNIAYLARVSNPNATPDMPSEKLIAFLIRNHHWSPFEMASMCVEINTTRDIGRQILRHRSFSFQEFSQRYAEVDSMHGFREARIKGASNRQGSLEERDNHAEDLMVHTARVCFNAYHNMIAAGVAPECARSILPEGFTPTKMYMTGTIRSWIHYLQQRTDSHTQKEHRDIAMAIYQILMDECPLVWGAAFNG
jgi:thymidylate synthase (FAD)